MPNNQQVLSTKCPNCGGTIYFTADKIATHCSFCGSYIPEMQNYVNESIKLNFEQQRHAMNMEVKDKEERKQKREYNAKMIPKIFALVIGLVYFIFLFFVLSRH